MNSKAHSKISRFGPTFPDLGWAPAPRYLLRRRLILDDLASLPPGRLLEVGPGIGALLHELASMGWDCTGVEASPAAYGVARTAAGDTCGVRILPRLPTEEGPFDCLMSFEVLEHIEDDSSALREWMSCLRPGGRVLLSVPSHPHRWSASDVLAGHCRRYDRDRLADLARSSGCDIESIRCYGWPLSNATVRVRAWRDRARMGVVEDGRVSRERRDAYTFASGIDRASDVRMHDYYNNAIGWTILQFSLMIQKLAFSTEMGNGYLLAGTKR